jgi:hypothetical protein
LSTWSPVNLLAPAHQSRTVATHASEIAPA